MLAYLTVGSEQLHDTSTRSLVAVDGLIGLPAPRGTVYDRPEADGAVEPANQYLSARIVTLEGEVWGQNVDTMFADFGLVARQLEAALSNDVVVSWQHYQGAVQLQGNARLAGEILPKIDGGAAVIAYQVQLRFADPRWYSQTEQSIATGSPSTSGGMPLPVVFPIPFGAGATGGSVSVTNSGTTTAYPTITIQGPIIAPVVENLTQGVALYFDGLNLAAGDSLVIDMNPTARTALVNGDNVAGAIRWTSSRFFGIGAGATETIDFYGQGAGYGAGTTMTVAWRDAYSS